MGRNTQQKKAVALLNADKCGNKISSSKIRSASLNTDKTVSKSSSSKSWSDHLEEEEEEPDPKEVLSYKFSFLDKCVDALYEKRETTREKALELLIKLLTNKVLYDYVQNNFLTILNLCLNSIKCGSAKEISLAAHLIGLLALTTGPGSKAREIHQESVGSISRALKSPKKTSKSKLLECLAIITFVGGEGTKNIENSLELIWQVANPDQSTDVIADESDPSKIMATAVSAWSFLFTAITASTLSPESWQESISFLSSLLEVDDRLVRIAAGESLALVLETGNFKIFNDELNASSDPWAETSGYELVDDHELLSKVFEQVKILSAEPGGKGIFKNIQAYLEGGSSPVTSMKIGYGKTLRIDTWTQLIQLNFIKHFLGGGFMNHMQTNEFLQDLFGLNQEKSLPETPETNCNRNREIFGYKKSPCEKRLFMSPNSFLNKTRTQIRNKARMLTQDKYSGCYGDEVHNT